MLRESSLLSTILLVALSTVPVNRLRIIPYSGSNLQVLSIDVPSSTPVYPLAGIGYSSVELLSNGGLSTSITDAKMKISSTDCDDEAQTVYPGTSASASIYVFESVTINTVGSFLVCYWSVETSSFNALDVSIIAYGSDYANSNHWCSSDSPDCKILITGLFPINPEYSRIGLIQSDGTCGQTSLLIGVADNHVSVSYNFMVTELADSITKQVHSLGGMKQVVPATYTVCHCTTFDANHENGICSETEDFLRPIGILVVTSVKTVGFYTPADYDNIQPEMKVITGLRFSIQVICGDGNCSSDPAVRYKIIDKHPRNELPVFERGGCRTAKQTIMQVNENCGNALSCEHHRIDVLSSNPSLHGVYPTFSGLQVRNISANFFSVSTIYDICYCESSCNLKSSWRKVGVVYVNRITADFLGTGNVVINPIPNIQGIIRVSGTSEQNSSWNGSAGSNMKVIDGHVPSYECYTGIQSSSFINGHSCESVASCDLPSSSLAGQTYGLNPSRKLYFRTSGFRIVCYCDNDCSVRLNWVEVRRLAVRGPTPDQSWFFPTGLPFLLNISGVGLTKDNMIRIVDMSTDCGKVETEQSNFAQGPSLNADVLSGEGNIKSIEYTEIATSIITFGTIEGVIEHNLSDGDYIEIEGVAEVSSDELKSRDQKDTETAMINNLHKVHVIDDTRIEIPLAFSTGAVPNYRIQASNVRWWRSSVETFRGIKLSKAGSYRACWAGFGGTDNTDFAVEAGRILIIDPPEIACALYLTTSQTGVVQHMIISWTTGSHIVYERQAAYTQVKLLFTNRTLLDPRDRRGSRLLSSGTNNKLEHMRQNICGQFLIELWSSDSNGFPVPAGCYFDENGEENSLSFFIVFQRRSGLKSDTVYRIAIMGVASPGISPENPPEGSVQIWVMDDIESNPFGVVDIGKARIDRTPTDSDPTSNGSPEFHPIDGFMIVADTEESGSLQLKGHCISASGDGDFPHVDLRCAPCSTESDCGDFDGKKAWCISPPDSDCMTNTGDDPYSFEFILRASSGANPIEERSILRIFLRPFQAWDIQTNVDISCIPHPSSSCGSGLVDVTVERISSDFTSFVGTQNTNSATLQIDKMFDNKNVIKMVLPSQMESITDTTMHRFRVSSLSLPWSGFFPISFAAELRKSDDTQPRYWDGLGQNDKLVWVQPRILSAAVYSPKKVYPHLSYGNLKPFKGEKSNVHYLRIVSGTALYAPQDNNARLSIELPVGYRCNQGGFLCVESDHCVRANVVPESLGVFAKVFSPIYRGLIGQEIIDINDEAEWAQVPGTGDYGSPGFSPPRCILGFKKHMVLYPDAVYYLGISVDNPETALQVSDTANKWSMSMSVTISSTIFTTGVFEFRKPLTSLHDADVAIPYIGFTDINAEDFAPNIAVVGKLSETSMTPTNYAFGEKQYINVFFRTENQCGVVDEPKSIIMIKAPLGFDLQEYCAVTLLPTYYYTKERFFPPLGYTTEFSTNLVDIEPGTPCIGFRDTSLSTFNVAHIYLTKFLRANTIYGLRLQVRNPQEIPTVNDWRISTFTRDLSACDASYNSVGISPIVLNNDYSSWLIYQRAIPSGDFTVHLNATRRQTGYDQDTTLITVFPIRVSVRSRSNILLRAPVGYSFEFQSYDFRYTKEDLPFVDASLPLTMIPRQPLRPPFNELALLYLSDELIPGISYGLQCRIRTPENTPTTSANLFTLEIGYDGIKLETRVAAGIYEAPPVSSVVDGEVLFRSSLRSIFREEARAISLLETMEPEVIAFSDKNPFDPINSYWYPQICIFFKTVTFIYRGGVIIIVGPSGFRIHPDCHLVPFRESNPIALADSRDQLMFLPPDVHCASANDEAKDQTRIEIFSGVAGITPGSYHFCVQAWNPGTFSFIARSWSIGTFNSISENDVLDHSIIVRGFTIKDPLSNSAVVNQTRNTNCLPATPDNSCSIEDRSFWLTGRDDRPGKRSNVIIEFGYSSEYVHSIIDVGQQESGVDTAEEMLLTIRAPLGFRFDHDCKILTGDTVFVSNASNPSRYSGYTPFPDGVDTFPEKYSIWPPKSIQSCTGDRNVADIRITVTDDSDSRIERDKLYVFQIPVINPERTPLWNFWTVEFGQESSFPIRGYDLTALQSVKISPRGTSTRSLNDFTGNNGIGMNSVEIEFTQFTPIGPGDSISILAPTGFLFETECAAQIQELELLTHKPIDNFGVNCVGTQTRSNKCILYLDSGGNLRRFGKYRIIVNVLNPQFVSHPRDWEFNTYQSIIPVFASEPVDHTRVEGFSVNLIMNECRINGVSSNSGVSVTMLTFLLKTRVELVQGDRIVIFAPIGYYFHQRGSSVCDGITFSRNQSNSNFSGFQNSELTSLVELVTASSFLTPYCAGNMVQLTVTDKISELKNIVFSVHTVNPPETPTENYFHCEVQRNNQRYISRVINGFEVVSRLELQVSLVIPIVQASKGLSTVQLSFEKMHTANLLVITGKVESGDVNFFSFVGASIYEEPPDFEIVRAGLSVLVLKIPESTEKRSITIQGITNPSVGVSSWVATSYIVDSADLIQISESASDDPPNVSKRRDQSDEVNSFSVLGRIIFLSSTRAEPNLFGAIGAVMYLVFTVSVDIPPYSIIRISGAHGFEFYRGTASIDSVDAGEQKVYGTSYDVETTNMISAHTDISLRFQANLPLAGGSQGRGWLVTIFDRNEKTDKETILATNDKHFQGVGLVGPIFASIAPDKQTPGVLVDVTVVLRLEHDIVSDSGAILVRIMAPAGFKFSLSGSCMKESYSAELARLDALQLNAGSDGNQINVSGLGNIFRSCIGTDNTASLISRGDRLYTGDTRIEMLVENSRSAPERNIWTISVFDGLDSTDQVNTYSLVGYPIKPMTAMWSGSDQLDQSSAGFLTFKAGANILSIIILEIIPPSSFVASCDVIYNINLDTDHRCSRRSDGSIKLTLTGVSSRNISFLTIGIHVSNPTQSNITENEGNSINSFGIILRDENLDPIDANMDIRGPVLRNSIFRCLSLTWETAFASQPATLVLTIQIVQALEDRDSTEIPEKVIIDAPADVTISYKNGALGDSITITPEDLPLHKISPLSVGGNRLAIRFSEQDQELMKLRQGLIRIGFSVRNPKRLPNHNIWQVTIINREGQRIMSHSFPGYRFS